MWKEIDLDDAVWRLPKERMKMKKRPHIVPLSSQAVEIFKQLQPVTGQYEHVFVAAGNRPICENAVLSAIRSFHYVEGTGDKAHNMYYFGKDDISAHGFRATASTRLHEEGWPDAAIELQLAHVIGDSVKRAYDYAKYLATRREMMQWWADYLDSLRDGTPKPPKSSQALRG